MASPQTLSAPLPKENSTHTAPPGPTRASARPAYTMPPMHSPYSWVPPTAARAQIARSRRPSPFGPLRRPLHRPRLHHFLRHMAPPISCIFFIVEGSSPQISSFGGTWVPELETRLARSFKFDGFQAASRVQIARSRSPSSIGALHWRFWRPRAHRFLWHMAPDRVTPSNQRLWPAGLHDVSHAVLRLHGFPPASRVQIPRSR